MTRLPVELCREALDEAGAAERWYRERNDRAALRFVAELKRALALLADNPAVGPRWEHTGVDERVRRLPLETFPVRAVLQPSQGMRDGR